VHGFSIALPTLLVNRILARRSRIILDVFA